MDTSLWKQYVDSLADILKSHGAQASLSDHPTLTGGAREHAIKEFFLKILPGNAGITTGGRSFDRQGNRSRELDVIIYDKNFPVLQIGANFHVPIEGVVAAFEIKSMLTKGELQDALEKCLSLAKLQKQYRRLNQIGGVTVRDQPPSIDELDKMLPGFYVYGFNGYPADANALLSVLWDWIQTKGVGRLSVPRIVVTPTAIALRKRDDIRYNENKEEGKETILTATLSGAGVNVLVADVLEKILNRFSYVAPDFTFRSMADYFDPNWYLEQYVFPTTADWKNVDVKRMPPGW
ncbi:MAG TPA: hypothetical protein PKK23_20865 [Nitrospirales bacterium]|nr:hypothetical protein [Nitrospiraceae bacterium]HNP31511.1 hypothetical protein [Nitrospirales bacterium]